MNLDYWRAKIVHMTQTGSFPAEIDIMESVLHQLSNGADSQVKYPGTVPTKCPNVFLNPEVNLPRIADALASEIMAEHMAGPIFLM